MSEKPKRKRTPITLVKRVNMIAAFLICLVVGFVGLHLLLVTGAFCTLLPVAACLFFLVMMGVVGDEAEAEKAKQNEAYTARPIVDEGDTILDEEPKQDLRSSL